MDYINIEKKWQENWKKSRLNSFDYSKIDKKYYVLSMFSYPSASNLHIGHWYNFAPVDTYARFKKMQGYEVFQPMGFDSFGLPAENHAIKTGIHPEINTHQNIEIMEGQLRTLGAMYDWDKMVITSQPDYYRWTQWLFLQLYKRGLAYQKFAPVNWCTSCNTVIANEQVVNNACERCKGEVVKKNLVQWFFKITDYAEELLSGLENLDWPEKTKAMQQNWIGKSTGCEIDFKISDSDKKISVFTTRADTLMGVSYVVLAPEHPLVDEIASKSQKEIVENYKQETAKVSDIDRVSDKRDKTGVFTGAYCIHPISQQQIPIWIADYCLASYGTGAVMGVPAHDTRDFEFAKKHNLPIKRVIKGTSEEIDDSLPFVEHGILVDSLDYDGLDSLSAQQKIANDLQNSGQGGPKTTYRLRDWSVSRQRYWGCPIPIIYCEKCGTVPVPEERLPVLLPKNVNFTPDGKSPLSKSEEYINTTCPTCGGAAKRDADTLDTFVCSSWYFLRYPDNKNQNQAFDSQLINKMLPVDKYVGGPEHACMHLLYSRFIVKALRDMGYLNFDEPFKSLIHQGLILGPDGEKMSKSNGNVVNPDVYTAEYGSDIFRMYLMFGFSYIEGGPWNDNGIKAMARFLDRVKRILDTAREGKDRAIANNAELEYVLNFTIKSVGQDLENFSFNTAIARIMELVNAMYKYSEQHIDGLLYECGEMLIRVLAPFAPHFSEEMHQQYGFKESVFLREFPIYNPKKLEKNTAEIVIQVNSKIRSRLTIDFSLDNDQIAEIALKDPKVQEFINDKPIKKTIVVKGKLINFIV